MQSSLKNGISKLYLIAAFILLACLASLSFAKPELPFNIVPNGPLPTSILPNTTVTASYTVTNNTTEQRNDNFVKYLPPNVAQDTAIGPGICGLISFDLSPRGNAGDSCTLNLIITGGVDANDPDPHHHLFVCFPEGLTCAGTRSPLNVNAIVPVSVTLTPATETIDLGETLQYTATATFSDGSTMIVTPSTWSSSNPNVASINGSGLATANSPGTTTITANYMGVLGTATLTVVNPLQSVTVIPSSASIVIGQTATYKAIANYSDGTSVDVTTSATWSSSNTDVATMAANVATGVSAGSTTITAIYSGFAGTSPLTVTYPLQSVTVIPSSASIFSTQTLTYKAFANYSDGTSVDVTSTASWTSSNTSVATMAANVATGNQTGSTTITAVFDGKAGTSTLTVSNPLTSIVISSSTTSIEVGENLQFSAVGHYYNGDTADLTTQVTWNSSDTSVATINGSGLAHGEGAGTSQITASMDGITSNTIVLSVSNELQSIVVTPANPVVTTGDQQQFVATGHYQVGDDQVITEQVNWTSSDTTVATISNTSGSKGLATALKVGTTTITATTASGPVISGSTTLTVKSFLYVVNTGTNTISYCSIGTSGGLACSITNPGITTPKQIAINPPGTFAYVVDTPSNKVHACSINTTNGFGSCDTGTTITNPGPIAINPSNTFAYIVTSAGVFRCGFSSGTLSTCQQTGTAFPALANTKGIVINPAGTRAYFTQYGAVNNVGVCNIDATTGALSACTTAATGTATGFATANVIAITINSTGTIAYVTNTNPGPPNDTVIDCPILSSGAFDGPNCFVTNGFSTPEGIAIDTASRFLYVSNVGGTANFVFSCALDVNGHISGACGNTSGFSTPLGVAIN